jgi:hypothetical protein
MTRTLHGSSHGKTLPSREQDRARWIGKVEVGYQAVRKIL